MIFLFINPEKLEAGADDEYMNTVHFRNESQSVLRNKDMPEGELIREQK